MSSQMSCASWNPAFMPDHEEISPKATYTSSSPQLSPPQIPPPSPPKSENDHHEDLLPKFSEIQSPDVYEEDVATNSPIKDLECFELQTSQDSSISGKSPADDLCSPDFVKANTKNDSKILQMDSKNSPNKHKSTMSFTRTVSEEVTWLDEEVDFDWTFTRTETDVSMPMIKSDRMNSFPQSQLHSHPENDSLLSQVEENNNVTHHIPREIPTENGDNIANNFFTQPSITAGQQQNDVQEISPAYDKFETDPIAQSVQSPENLIVSTDYRNEDYLSLRKSESHSLNGITYTNKHINQTEETNRIDELSNIFHNQAMTQVFERNPDIQETECSSNVLNPKSQNTAQKPDKPTAQILQKIQTSDINVDLNSAASSTHGTINTLPQNFSENLEVDKKDFNDNELVARWREALSADLIGDSLLEDDDLPPEVEQIEQAEHRSEIDPAVLFGSDDEGFLEDLDETAVNILNQGNSALNPHSSTNSTLGISHPNKAVDSDDFSKASTSSNQFISENTKKLNQNPESNSLSDSHSYNPSKFSETPILPRSSSIRPALNYSVVESKGTDMPKAKSFASMSKGGYSSPYDLPMDLVPRKRSSLHSINRVTSSQSTTLPKPNSQGSISTITSSNLTARNVSQPLQLTPTQSARVLRNSKSDFFEELPISSKSISTSRRSSYLPARNQDHQSNDNSTSSAVAVPPERYSPLSSQTPHSKLNQDLITPNQVSPYAPLSSANHSTSHPSTNNSIQTSQNLSQFSHSSAPHVGIKQIAPSYSASPPSSINMRSYHPRTSSPLAHIRNAQNAGSTSDHYLVSNSDIPRRVAGHDYNLRLLSPTREVDESGTFSSLEDGAPQKSTIENISMTSSCASILPAQTSHNRNVSSNMDVFRNPPLPYQDCASLKSSPQRPRTQSPESMLISSRNRAVKNDQYQRSASVESAFTTQPRVAASFPSINMSRDSNEEANYIPPSDGRELDPLQRWKGSPIFVWGVGGTTITSFPKSVPRYEIKQSFPAILRYPGEIKLQYMKEVNPLNSLLAQFPGPLKAKSKKKDVIAWLSSGIELLESDAANVSIRPISDNDKCSVERILLWKILRIFIEHDGTLEGTPNVEIAVRGALSPENNKRDPPLYATSAQLLEPSQGTTPAIQSDAVDPATIYKIKELLMQGQREKAVWESVDKRLWAHAILISNTVSQDLYKQVAQEFIQKELRTIGDKTQSLAALYEIFAGNFEESIDELVPPSARAGFQMVSTSNDRESSSDASNGLEKWRETLTLILSNRNVEDTRALTALGKLLASYGRTEAAHVCFLFARSHAVFGGIDDPLSSYVLVGSDQLKQTNVFGTELESILLSEVFEYGMSLSNITAAAVPIPHLAAYKLYFAKILAEHGLTDKAMKYCETIAAATTSQTKRSPYYHSHLIFEVEDLSQRLKQSPKDESGSWISKPSIDKARGSVWATFNKFVAGDESDGVDNASSSGTVPDFGPFSKITGGTPTISHSSSVTEFPGLSNNSPIHNTNIHPVSTTTASRYAPISSHSVTSQDSISASPHVSQICRSTTSRSLTDHSRYEPQRSANSTTDIHHSRPQIKQTVSTNSSLTNPYPLLQMPYIPDQKTISGYETTPVYNRTLDAEYSSLDSPSQSPKVLGNPYSTSFTSQQSNQISSMGIEASSNINESPTLNSYDPPKGGFEPHQSSTHEESDSSSGNFSRQKASTDYEVNDTSIIDNAIPLEKTRAEKDRETDEAFRRAAEADAQLDKKPSPVKSRWSLINWLGVGTKNQDAISAPNKPIRAKLGEASSFVYDPELKRWVNKKAGAEQEETKSPTPPPPRALGPLRSGNTPPATSKSSAAEVMSLEAVPLLTNRESNEKTLQPKNHDSSNNNIAGNDKPATSIPHGLPRTTSSSSIVPPSRPGTSMSNASSIDDLLGPPSLTRRSGNKMKKKGRGYVDVMSEVAS